MNQEQKLREALQDCDELLAYFEDFIHGDNGMKITNQRKQIISALSAPLVQHIQTPLKKLKDFLMESGQLSATLDDLIDNLLEEEKKMVPVAGEDVKEAAEKYCQDRWENSDNKNYFNSTACEKDFIAGANWQSQQTKRPEILSSLGEVWDNDEVFDEPQKKGEDVKEAAKTNTMENIKIFEKHFRSGMINKDFVAFQIAFPTLLKCILNAMNEVSAQTNEKREEKQDGCAWDMGMK